MRVAPHLSWCAWRSTGECDCGARAYVESTPRTLNEHLAANKSPIPGTLGDAVRIVRGKPVVPHEFHHGRLDAKVIDERKLGFIFVEFMREGDEEQHFDMTLTEALTFRDWLNAVLPANSDEARS